MLISSAPCFCNLAYPDPKVTYALRHALVIYMGNNIGWVNTRLAVRIIGYYTNPICFRC